MPEIARIQYQFDDWSFDPASHLLQRRGSEPLRIEPRASMLLRVLLEHAGRVVTLDDLFDSVWRSKVVEIGAIHRQVSSLRRTLEDSAKQPRYLQTISKRGYRFKVIPERIEDHSDKTAVLQQESSLAVLPFEYVGDNSSHLQLAIGLREDLITQLSRFTDITVRAPGAIGPGAAELVQHADQLKVAFLLTGSVRSVDDRLRITLRVCRSADAVIIWSNLYDTASTHVLEIYSDIALNVAQAMGIERSPRLRAAIIKPSTAHLNAYAHYIKALYHLKEQLDLHEALDELTRAIEIDSKFASAIAQKAYLYSVLTDTVGSQPAADRTSADAYARRAAEYADEALALDASEPHAYLAKASICHLNLQYAMRREYLERAFALEPNEVSTSCELAVQRFNANRPVDAYRLLKHALMIDPCNPAVPVYACFRSIWAQQWEYVSEFSSMLISGNPDAAEGYALNALSAAYLEAEHAMEKIACAESRLTNGVSASGKAPQHTLVWLLLACNRLGHRSGFRRYASLLRKLGLSGLDQQGLLLFHLADGNVRDSLGVIEDVVRMGFPPGVCRDLYYHRGHVFFEPVRDHLRFKRSMNVLAGRVSGEPVH